MKIEEEVNDARMKIAPASTVVAELTTPAGQKAKFKTRFVGYLTEQFILLQMPDLKKHPRLSAYFHDCSHITVRLVIEGHEGMIIAFQTTIKFEVKSPTWMLVLAIPKKVAVLRLRKVNRLVLRL